MTVSPTERMLLCVKVIQEAEDTDEGTEQQVKAVTEIQDWAEDLDIANGVLIMFWLSFLLVIFLGGGLSFYSFRMQI